MSCRRVTGVASMASMVPRSHSLAKTSEVKRVPMRVMMTVMEPGTRKFTLLAEGLYQKRSCTPICGSTMFFSCKRPLMCPWITLCA